MGPEGPEVEEKAEPGFPEGPPPRDAPWKEMVTRGGAQAPTTQQRNFLGFIKPGQLDGSRP
eukprot:7584625-Heterocapsa_arctica.AAC.1